MVAALLFLSVSVCVLFLLVLSFLGVIEPMLLGQMMWRELGETEREEYITKAEKVGDTCGCTQTHTIAAVARMGGGGMKGKGGEGTGQEG